MRRKVWSASLAALFCGTLIAAREAGFRFNETPSVPVGVWRLEAPENLKRGDIVSVCPPDTPLFRLAYDRAYLDKGSCPNGLQPLLKPVVAIPGDMVVISPAGVSVNGAALPNSRPLRFDSQGRTLVPFQTGHYVVGVAELWLISSQSDHSFDSRYFGPVLRSQLLGIAKPIWVRTADR